MSNLIESPDDIWQEDRLQRRETALFLSRYLEGLYAAAKSGHQHRSFVLNLNARWGFGKTFFLKRWQQELERAGHPVVYFDAWENDYSVDPLLGFIHQIDEAVRPMVSSSPEAKKALSKTVSLAKKVLKPSVPVLLEIIAKRLTHMSLDELSDLHDTADRNAEKDGEGKEQEKSVGSVVSKAAEAAFKEHKELKATISDFRKNLAILCKKIESKVAGKQLPLFVLVDELDRCKPTYAIQLLEHIKHLFGVDGVFFVVSTDSTQLAESVKAIYGAGFDSQMYLRRFFHQEYILPDPTGLQFANFLFEKYSLQGDEKLLSPLDKRYCSDSTPAIQLFAIMSKAFGASLRTQEQVCLVMRAIRISMAEKATHSAYCFFLIFLSVQRPDLFAAYAESMHGALRSDWTRQHLTPVFQTPVGIPTNISETFGSIGEETQVWLLDLFIEYDSKARSDRRKLNADRQFKERIFQTAAEQMLATDQLLEYKSSESYPPSFRRYCEYIQRAGQLHR